MIEEEKNPRKRKLQKPRLERSRLVLYMYIYIFYKFRAELLYIILLKKLLKRKMWFWILSSFK